MWDSYPRPQMKRKDWQNLNGTWRVNGVLEEVPAARTEEHLLYERSFHFHRKKARVLLHFGAVDQTARVTLNGKYIGEHIGGYLPFTFEISDVVNEGENVLKVEVTDTLDHSYPYGKQTKKPGGMWYTAVSGIWQTVWIEQVPESYIQSVRITPDLKGATLEVRVNHGEESRVRRERIEPEQPEYWTPEHPKLYTYIVREGEDEAEIYYALRTVDIREIQGRKRVCLNGKPIFLHGVLDQGYFDPGRFLPETPIAYEQDILRLKDLGFNMLRKHIKVEPEVFYAACDRLGILVMQDMVNSGDYHFFRDTVLGTLGLRLHDTKTETDERMRFFISHCEESVTELYNHPSVCFYTIFNEGWGQFNSDAIYTFLKTQDPTRLYDAASGWFQQEESDFDSLHVYFRMKKLKPKSRPMLLSECGGYTLNLRGGKKTYGYGAAKDQEELTNKIVHLYETMVIPAVRNGLCGCIYTQLSDIEEEINGLFTYDRKDCKIIPEKLRRISECLRAELEASVQYDADIAGRAGRETDGVKNQEEN